MPRKRDFAKTKEKGMFENAKFSQKVRMRESVLQGVREDIAWCTRPDTPTKEKRKWVRAPRGNDSSDTDLGVPQAGSPPRWPGPSKRPHGQEHTRNGNAKSPVRRRDDPPPSFRPASHLLDSVVKAVEAVRRIEILDDSTPLFKRPRLDDRRKRTDHGAHSEPSASRARTLFNTPKRAEEPLQKSSGLFRRDPPVDQIQERIALAVPHLPLRDEDSTTYADAAVTICTKALVLEKTKGHVSKSQATSRRSYSDTSQNDNRDAFQSLVDKTGIIHLDSEESADDFESSIAGFGNEDPTAEWGEGWMQSAGLEEDRDTPSPSNVNFAVEEFHFRMGDESVHMDGRSPLYEDRFDFNLSSSFRDLHNNSTGDHITTPFALCEEPRSPVDPLLEMSGLFEPVHSNAVRGNQGETSFFNKFDGNTTFHWTQRYADPLGVASTPTSHFDFGL
ncbi:hypothetical protein AAVH_07474 [Aphelenchoides avenae]|nr:hypothetical protein AAVH_07474 [Aphelenchus avenae]